MKNILKKIPVVLILIGVFASCSPDINQDEELVNIEDDLSTNILNIPEGFDFSTSQEVTINIIDNENAFYEVFATSEDKYFVRTETFVNEAGETVTEDVYSEDIIERQVLSGIIKDGALKQTITLPKNTSQLYVRRNYNLETYGTFVDVLDKKVNYNHTTYAGKANTYKSKNTVYDFLFCVNGEGDLFQVNPLNGNYTFLSKMPMGSFTAAIDQANLVMYSIGRSSPNPLMKYDIKTKKWSTVANLNFGGPRLDFNTRDNLLYFSNSDYVRTIDPNTGKVLKEWKINGLHNKNGGDLAFAPDGTFYLASFSGLYKLNLNNSGEYDADRISADNLPFTPTSMTIDSKGELWLADNKSDGSLIVMDTQTGGWQYNFGKNANNGTNFGRKINDLTTFKVIAGNSNTKDTDGDGIVDSQDAYPLEANKAFEVFTPSKYGKGTIAFEDLYPSYGDYDFNDVAFSYRAIAVLNSDNLAVQLDFICRVKANGAGFTNGFGIELRGVSSSDVKSVIGTNLTQDYISLNSNGTEAGHQNAVVIFTDDQDNFLEETTVSIIFNKPISTQQLGAAPFNPFIIKNKERANEIHLPYYPSTKLGSSRFSVSDKSRDLDGNFISDKGYPWAISIVHDFKVPKERVAIDEAYNFFSTWATSGGEEYKDWYKDNTGYRNTNKVSN